MSSDARVLATDDRPEILRLIERTLDSHYDCEFASNVSAAREKLAASEFALALCDIQMPGESGLDLAEEIVKEHPGTAVVLLTGEDDLGVARQAFDFGAHGYLVKPFWPGQLLITAMGAIRRQHLELALEEQRQALAKRLQVVMDRAPVSIYMTGRDGRFVFANKVAHENAGRRPNEMVGLRAEDIMSVEAARAVTAAHKRVLEEGMTFEVEETLQIGSVERTFSTVKFPFVDDDGEIAGVYGISRDITDRKRAEVLTGELARSQNQAIAELRNSRQETVDRLARAIERHDSITGKHISRMATVAALLARRCGFDEEQVLLLRAAAPMHDVGKVATPDAILRKPGRLTGAERVEMERHTTVGYEILSGSESELLQMAARIALTHHEHWDGTGYPRGLSGEQIPIEGRVVAVADVFDALLSNRSYRPAMSVEEAVATLRAGRGSHFDPEVIDRLLDDLDEALAVRG